MQDVFKCNRLQGAHVLRDLMDTVCRYLHIKDLCSVAQTCRVWNQAVKRELEYRSPQRITVYESYNIYVQESFIKIKPYVVILFIQQDLDASQQREKRICLEYRKTFPHTLLALGADKVYTNKNIMDTDDFEEENSFILRQQYEIPGFILPYHYTIEVKFTWYTRKQLQLNQGKDVLKKLIPKNKKYKTVLMIFTYGCNNRILINNIMKSIKKSFKKNSYSLWGGELFSSPTLYTDKKGNISSSIGLFGLSLTGPNINSYSLVVQYVDKDASSVYEDIMNFEESIILRTHSFGFVNSPMYEDYLPDASDEEMSKQLAFDLDEFYKDDYEKAFLFCIKKAFPNTPFFSTFRDNYFQVFGTDSFNDDVKSLCHHSSFSLLIITYY